MKMFVNSILCLLKHGMSEAQPESATQRAGFPDGLYVTQATRVIGPRMARKVSGCCTPVHLRSPGAGDPPFQD